jgi:raffinose/stachyose/melibiose transport system substrate-binding protein
MRKLAMLCGGAALAIAAGASAGGAGAAPSATYDPAKAGNQTLTIWTSESGERLKLVKQLGATFTKKYPNIKISWVVRDFGSYPAQLKLALSSSHAPDVCIGNLGWSLDGPLIQDKLIRPLTPWVKQYGWDKRYPQNELNQLRFTTDGKVFGAGEMYGVPYAADVIGWFYNVDKLKKLGVGVPKTFAQLQSDFAKAKAAGEIPIQLGNKDQWPALHLYFNIDDTINSGSHVTSLVYNKNNVKWTDPAFVKSAQMLATWYKDGYIPSGTNGVAYGDATAAFSKGQGVFLPAGSWVATGLPAGKFGFFLTPPVKAGDKPRATGSFGYGWHISTKSKLADLSAAFINWETNATAARLFYAAGDIAPLQVKNPQLKPGKLTKDIFTSFQSVLKNDTLLPYLDFSDPNGGGVIYPTFQRILTGNVDAQGGLKTIESAREKFVDSLK